MQERIGNINIILFALYYNEAVITQILGTVKRRMLVRFIYLRLHIT